LCALEIRVVEEKKDDGEDSTHANGEEHKSRHTWRLAVYAFEDYFGCSIHIHYLAFPKDVIALMEKKRKATDAQVRGAKKRAF